MIDPWFFTAFCLALLAACALVRVLRIPVIYDRIVAATVTITIGAAAGLMLSIGTGSILILDIVIILALLAYGAVIASGAMAKEASA